MALEITDTNFEQLASENELLIVDIWGECCAPCRMLSPIIDELARQYEGKVAIGKLNGGDNPDVCAKFGVRSLPTILFIKNGEVIDKYVGAIPKKNLVEKIDALL